MTEIDYLQSVVKPLVDHVAEVDIDKKTDERGILLTLGVNNRDLGRIIGKNGQTANALRLLLHLFGSKTDQVISLKVKTPEEHERR